MRIKLAMLLLAFLGILLVVYLLGPRPEMDARLNTPDLPEDLDGYLGESEARHSDLKPNAAKRIVWARADRSRTPVSIIYLHGFSASHREIAPVCENVAHGLRSNLYLARFSGHGRSGEAMLEGSLNKWVNDANEALAIGRRIGERTLVVATSNGASIAAWLMAQQKRQDDLLGLVMISPNFGPRDRRSRLLAWPWGERLAEWAQGPTFSWEPRSELHKEGWTIGFPTRALVPMQAVVNLLRRTELSRITVPTLVLYTRQDRVVDPSRIEAAFPRIGSSLKRLVAYEGFGEHGHHVLAGDALSPQSNDEITALILSFASDAAQHQGRVLSATPPRS